jgi:hypothetical protein
MFFVTIVLCVAIFGIIWKYFVRDKLTRTLEEFKKQVQLAFEGTKITLRWLDGEWDVILVVPDYMSWLKGSFDTEFSGAFKTEKTMHRWRFEAVEESIYFPTGVKVTFRLYSSDECVELIEKPPQSCISPMGRFIG